MDDMNDLWLRDQNDKDMMNKLYLVGVIKASSNILLISSMVTHAIVVEVHRTEVDL